MKIYHDHNEDLSWTEITNIRQYPEIVSRLDNTSYITFIIRDFEGALYSTWEGYNFIPIKVEDDSSNIIWRGYLTGKKYSFDSITCTCHGLSVRLDWIPIHKNYILSDGKVSAVPHDGAGAVGIVRPNGIENENWAGNSGGAGDNYTFVDDAVSYPDTSTSTYLDAESLDDSDPEQMEMGTLTVDSVQDIWVYIYALDHQTSNDLQVDISNDSFVSSEGNVELTFGDDVAGWQIAKFTAIGWNQAQLNTLSVKMTAPSVIAVGKYFRCYIMYAEIYYTGEQVESITVTDNEDVAYSWSSDYWNINQDVGLLIIDNSNDLTSKTWQCDVNPTLTNGTLIWGTADALDTANDGNDEDELYYFKGDGSNNSHTFTPVLGTGDQVADTNKLEKIDINYRIGSNMAGGTVGSRIALEIEYNGASWKTIFQRNRGWGSDSAVIWASGTFTIDDTDTELQKYLTKDGANYDKITNIRLRVWRPDDVTAVSTSTSILIDKLTATIKYYEHDIAPLMETITGNGASNIKCATITMSESGVRVGDYWKIGENTTNILGDIETISGVSITLQSTLSKYIAQHYKGVYCKEALKNVCLLEGLHWWEDYVGNQIIVSKEADFIDSTEDFTEADYGYHWSYEDDNNYFKAVEVYGAAGLGIYYKAEDVSIDSPRTKCIIEETVTTVAEAKEIADELLAEIKTKQPSIELPLKGVYTNLTIGKTAGLTMARPTVVAADYPIRMMKRTKFGGAIKTHIWCGLGHSTTQEKIADVINKANYIAHKAHTDRLISTTTTAGASLTWGDVGGAEAAVNALIATHTADDDAHGDWYTEAEVDALIPGYVRVQLERVPISAAAWVNDYVQLNAVNEDLTTSFYIGSYMDAAADMIITFSHICTSADATVACKWYVAAIADGEAFSWNIESATAFNADSTVASRKYTTSYTLANAGIATGDNINIRFRLNEAARDMRIYNVSLLYKHKTS